MCRSIDKKEKKQFEYSYDLSIPLALRFTKTMGFIVY